MREPDDREAKTGPMGRGPAVHNEFGGAADIVVQGRDIAVNLPPPAPAAVPRQAPPPPEGFIDRLEETELLRRLAGQPGQERPRVVAITGLPGVGKTALLRKAAAVVGDRFADGVLYADFGPLQHRGGAAVSEVVAGMLRGLGVHDRWIPPEFSDRLALLRSMTARRSMLVLLDDVQEAVQVTALLPSSPASMVVAAGSMSLEQLLVDGARLIVVAPLDVAHGVDVLAALCSAERLAAEPGRAVELVQLCGRLPLAIRVAGARLAGRPTWSVGQLVEELGQGSQTLEGLTVGGRPVVAAVFDASYADLPGEAARLYRWLGLLPGPHFGVEAAAAVGGVTRSEARALVEALCLASLLQERADGRFEFHSLVRMHAARRAERDDPDEVRAGALRRGLAWWLRSAAAADVDVMGSGRLRIADHGEPPTGWQAPFARGDGLEWLDHEHPMLLGLLREAADRGWDPEVWQLFEALFALYINRKPLECWTEAGRLAVDSARRCGDRRAEVRVRCLYARAFQELVQFDQAHAQLEAAREAAALIADQRLLASVLDFTGNVYFHQGDYRAALADFERSLAINERISDQRGVGLQAQFVGRALGRLGRTEEALAALERACSVLASLGDERTVSRVLVSLGRVYLDAERTPEATAALEAALEVIQRLRLTGLAAEPMELLAQLASRRGDQDAEAAYLDQAIALHAASGSPRAAVLRARRDAVSREPFGEGPASA